MIYKYKTEGISPNDFSNYQKSINLFINLRDRNINPKEVLKNQINFKSYLGQIKKGNPNLKSKDQINVMQNVEIFFDLREKIIGFLEIILFCYLKLNTKQNMEKFSKH